MTRWTTWCLVGLGTYGLVMAVTGVTLALDGLAGAPSAEGDPLTASAAVSTPQTGPDGAALPALPVSPELPVAPSLVAAAPLSSLTAVEPLDGAGRTPGPTSSVGVARQATAGPGQTTSFHPVELTLPNGATAPIKPADVAADGSLTIPDNPRVVGLWTGSALPGEQFGSIVIAGHVDSARYGIGVLAGLKGVKAGEVIELSAGKASLRYRVATTATVKQQSLASDADLFAQDGPPRLVVITCGGPFDPVRHRYQDNYIVTATPIV